jgi:hypothetical protein
MLRADLGLPRQLIVHDLGSLPGDRLDMCRFCSIDRILEIRRIGTLSAVEDGVVGARFTEFRFVRTHLVTRTGRFQLDDIATHISEQQRRQQPGHQGG